MSAPEQARSKVEVVSGVVTRVRNVYELLHALESGAVAAVAPVDRTIQILTAPLYKVMNDNNVLESFLLSGEKDFQGLLARSSYARRFSENDITAALTEGRKILDDVKEMVSKMNSKSKQKYKISKFFILPGNGEYEIHADIISLSGIRLCRTYVGPSTLYFKHEHGDPVPLHQGEPVVSAHTHKAWHSAPTLFPFQRRITAVVDLLPE